MKWLRDNYKMLLLVGGEIVTALWTAASIVLDLFGLTQRNYVTDIFTLSSLILFIALVYIHIFSLQKKLLPRIDMIFGDYPACHHKFPTAGGNTGTLFRVGLINSGMKTIEDVQVDLEQIEPQGITHGPIRLIFMHQRKYDDRYKLHPGSSPSLFIDVIQDIHIEPPLRRVFSLPYAVSGVANTLEPANYRLTLVAKGQDVPSIRKHFTVNWDGNEMLFSENNVS